MPFVGISGSADFGQAIDFYQVRDFSNSLATVESCKLSAKAQVEILIPRLARFPNSVRKPVS